MTTINRRSALMLGAALIPAMSFADEMTGSTDGPMSRKPERQLSKDEALFIINHTEHAVLSMADKADFPYGIPVTPIDLDGKIYFHGSNKGRKGKDLEQNPNVSLCWIGGHEVAKGEFAINYASAIVTGKAHLVTDPEKKTHVLMSIVHRMDPSVPDKDAQNYIKAGMGRVSVWEVDIEKISGKARNKQVYFGKFPKKA